MVESGVTAVQTRKGKYEQTLHTVVLIIFGAACWFLSLILKLPLNMKTHFFFAFVLPILLVMPAFSQQPSQTPPTISVTGSAEVKVAPDEVYLRVAIDTRHENLAEAKRQNDERVSKALAFLKTSGINSKDVQTDFVSIEPTYDNDLSQTKPVIFVARKSIEVKVTNVSSFEGLLTGLLTNGVNHVNGIEFRTSELRKHRDAARAMAVRAAREKADALAAELGIKRGKVYSVNASEWGGWLNGSANYFGGNNAAFQNGVQDLGGASGSADTPLSVGQISISASVNVSFLIE